MFPSPKEFDEYLAQLENLNLSEETAEKKVYDLFNKLLTLPITAYSLPADFPTTRARINYNGDRFKQKEEVWYKPDEYNTGYGRANNTELNVFYGAIDPYPANNDINKPIERMTALCEISDIYFSEPKETTTETVTFSRWYLGKELLLACPFDFSKLSSESPILSDLDKAFKKTVKENQDYKEQINRFHTFISEEFSKHPIDDEHEYKITALFTEMMIKSKFDGIIYPSVKTEKVGFNIAIPSQTVKDNFQLFAVAECTHYRKEDYSTLNNDLLAIEIDDDGFFELSPGHPYKLTEKEILQDIEENTS